MTDKQIPDNESPAYVMVAISSILRPLVRLLLSHNLSFQTFCNLVKSTYVQVADEEFRLPAKPQTDSRISLLTGIQRREVNRLRNEQQGGELNLPSHASMSALLLTIWSGHPDYVDKQGSPVPLPRLAKKGEEKSFESLVQSVSKDFRPRVVLDEWLRQGMVTLDDEDRVHLSADAFIQPQDMDEKLYYLGQNVRDHLEAVVHNLQGHTPPFLERCVFYDKLSPESLQELTEYSRAAGMRALHAINKRAAELQKRDQGQLNANYRTNFGIYNFSEMETQDE